MSTTALAHPNIALIKYWGKQALPGNVPATPSVSSATEIEFGPLCHQFNLTLSPGTRTEVLGPLFYHQNKNGTKTWAVPPLFSYTRDEATDFEEFVDRWGIRRTSPRFWSTVDWIHQDAQRRRPTKAGIFDFGRYQNL